MQLPGEFSPFIEKKCFFLSGGGGGFTPPYTLSGPTTKENTFFMCVFPYYLSGYMHVIYTFCDASFSSINYFRPIVLNNLSFF